MRCTHIKSCLFHGENKQTLCSFPTDVFLTLLNLPWHNTTLSSSLSPPSNHPTHKKFHPQLPTALSSAKLLPTRQTPPASQRSRRMHFWGKSTKPVIFVFFALIFKNLTKKRMMEYFVLTESIESRVIFRFRCWNTTGIPGIWRKHFKKQEKCTVTFHFSSYH